MSRRWFNASWRLWSRPVDHYHVYFHGLLYRATIIWHREEEEELIGWYEPGWPKTRTKEVWHKRRHYKLVTARTAYRRNPEHQKKDLPIEEHNRRLWRKRVRRGNNWQGHHGPGRWVKKQTTFYNRAWAKHCIQRDRDEDIHRKYGKYRFGYWS